MSKNLKLKKVIKRFVPKPISCFSGSSMFMNICERFPYPYEYVYFTCSYLGRIFGPGYASVRVLTSPSLSLSLSLSLL